MQQANSQYIFTFQVLLKCNQKGLICFFLFTVKLIIHYKYDHIMKFNKIKRYSLNFFSNHYHYLFYLMIIFENNFPKLLKIRSILRKWFAWGGRCARDAYLKTEANVNLFIHNGIMVCNYLLVFDFESLRLTFIFLRLVI